MEHDNYTNPIKTILGSDILQGSAASARLDQYFFKTGEYTTDSGLILEDKKVDRTFRFDYKTSFSIASNPLFVFEVICSLGNLVENYSRSYVKVQSILASTGGFIKFILMMLTVLNTFYINKFVHEEIFLDFQKSIDTIPKKGDAFNPDSLFMKNSRNNFNNNFILPKPNTIMNNLIEEPRSTNHIITTELRSRNENALDNNLHKSNPKSSKSGTLAKKTNFKDNIKKKQNYKKMTCFEILFSFVNKTKKFKEKHKILKQVEKDLQNKLDIKNIFRLSLKVDMNDNIIYGEMGRKVKDFLLSVNFLSNLGMKTHEEIPTFTEITGSIEKIKESKNIIDVNEKLVNEAEKLNNL
jgi:hypothetical protein